VSTILKALDKRRGERERGDDPESLLERNAAYREAIRRRNRRAALGRRILFGFAFLAIGAALAGSIALIWMGGRGGSRNTGSMAALTSGTKAAATPTPTPAARPVATPRVPPRPIVRQTVRLRTRPLLREKPRPAPKPPATPVAKPSPPPAPVYSAGPHPPAPKVTPTPAPVATPRPTAVVASKPTTPSASRKPAAGPPKKETPPQSALAKDDPRNFLKLTGIVLDPKNPYALINERIVSVGDVVDGAKVLAIDSASSLRVEYHGKQYKLELK